MNFGMINMLAFKVHIVVFLSVSVTVVWVWGCARVCVCVCVCVCVSCWPELLPNSHTCSALEYSAPAPIPWSPLCTLPDYFTSSKWRMVNSAILLFSSNSNFSTKFCLWSNFAFPVNGHHGISSSARTPPSLQHLCPPALCGLPEQTTSTNVSSP